MASSRNEAEKLLEQQEFDVLFTDIMLDREQGGLELLRTTTVRNPATKVIIMTGYPDVATAAEAVRCGAFDYLCKPFDSQQIRSITRHALENRRLLQEREQYRANLEAINRSIVDAIVMVDNTLCLQHSNIAACQYGYSATQLGKAISQIPSICCDSCHSLLADTVRTGIRHELKRIECFDTTRQMRIISIVATPTIGEDGRRIGAVAVIRDETELDSLKRQLKQRSSFRDMVGQAPVMQQLFTRIEALADVSSTVLIYGESGTGKELVAKALHESGTRRNKPFVRLNCSALPEGLLESELFGHVRGAFTGAFKDKVGRFQKAHGGTIFLDEIGDISPALQIRLLRVLQEREIERVGDTTPIRIDVRILTATHRNLLEKVRRGEFRQDLYYRLNVVNLQVPPLRERLEDLPLLINHFLSQFSHKFSRSYTSVTEDVLAAFRAHPWPGNIRELEHLIEHACIISQSPVISSESLPPEFFQQTVQKPMSSATSTTTRQPSPLSLEQALQLTAGNRSEAARLLGISRRTLYRRLDDDPTN